MMSNSKYKNIIFGAFVSLFVIAICFEFIAISNNFKDKHDTTKTENALLLNQQNSQEQVVTSQDVIDGIRCENMEGSGLHEHIHLDIFVNGKHKTIPENIGIKGNGQCFFWLHTHDSTGIIHVESPEQRTFTLGEFFDIWKQPLTRNQVDSYSDGEPIHIFLNNKLYQGDPRQIILNAHECIVLEVGPKFVDPPAPFAFPEGD